MTTSLFTLQARSCGAGYSQYLSLQSCQTGTSTRPPSGSRPLGHPPDREEGTNVVWCAGAHTPLAARALRRMAARFLPPSAGRRLPDDLDIFGATARGIGCSSASADEGTVYPRAAGPLTVAKPDTADSIVAQPAKAGPLRSLLQQRGDTACPLPPIAVWQTISPC